MEKDEDDELDKYMQSQQQHLEVEIKQKMSNQLQDINNNIEV